MNKFLWPVRVYYEDTDAGGIVYHSNYLNFMERARTEWLRALGFEQDSLKQNMGVIFAVRSVNVDYLRPARFNDSLQVSVQVARVGKASITLKQNVRRESTADIANKDIPGENAHGDNATDILCQATIKIASIDAVRFKPVPVPEQILEIMK